MNIIAILNHIDGGFKEEPVRRLQVSLETASFQVIYPLDDADLIKMVAMNPRICGAIFDLEKYSLELCEQVHELNDQLPLFAFDDENNALGMSLADLRLNVSFFEYSLDRADDIALKIKQAVDAYKYAIMPPFTKALFKYVEEGKYTFCTPGHMGGAAFQRSPAGSMFYDFYGSNAFKADVSVSMPELGSLLDHSGPHQDAERYIAKTFNADHSYIVTNGTSTANKIVGMFSAPTGSTVLVDRNCHKSITHLLMMNNITPIYLKPTRNAYGIIGGIPQSEFSRDVIAEKVAAVEGATMPNYAVVTNSTYDGLLYNTQFIKESLGTQFIHFDSAWVPYTNFSSIYEGRSGMSGEAMPGKVFYETQSTHKLLAAFSQSSMIHIKGEIDKDTFNEAFMMHTSTSPQYSIVASTETAAAMMRGNTGKRLMRDSIELAIRFRKEIKRLETDSEGWFFSVWQPSDISKTECWHLDPQDSWHGFKDIDENHMYLDPIKVTLMTPGMEDDQLTAKGIPASIVAKFLDERGIVVEKTGPYNLLFLFSIGIDNAKSLQLLRALTEFKRGFDLNPTLKKFIPSLYAENPTFYADVRVQELAQSIHEMMGQFKLPQLMFKAFEVLPDVKITPNAAWQHVLNGETEEVRLEELINRVNANMVLPYPPGVTLIMPGEMITETSRPILDFLEMLCQIGSKFPGFETDIHGLYRQPDSSYKVKVLKQSCV